MESTDIHGRGVSTVRVDTDAPLLDSERSATAAVDFRDPQEAPRPYLGSAGYSPSEEPRPAKFIPYAEWANRGPSTMRMWIPTKHGDARQHRGERV